MFMLNYQVFFLYWSITCVYCHALGAIQWKVSPGHCVFRITFSHLGACGFSLKNPGFILTLHGPFGHCVSHISVWHLGVHVYEFLKCTFYRRPPECGLDMSLY